MSLYKRGNVWWVAITRRGETTRRSTGTSDKKLAQELHDKLKHESWRQDKLQEKPRVTFEQLAVRWLQERSKKRSIGDDADKIAWLRPHIKGYVDELTDAMWWDILLKKRKEGASDSTLNRYTALMRAMLNKAAGSWGWLDRAPLLTVLEEPPARDRFLTREECKVIHGRLPAPINDMFLFDLATGLRAGNLLNLQWGWIDMQQRLIRIPASEFKQGRSVAVPLSTAAIDVLKRQMGNHLRFVFAKDGQPVTRRSMEWQLKKATVGMDVRWHDVRRTWASWMRQAGAGLQSIKDAGGWQTLSVVDRVYALASTDHLLPEVDRLSESIAQIQHNC